MFFLFLISRRILTETETELITQKRYNDLVEQQKKVDAEIDAQLSRREEDLRLEEEVILIVSHILNNWLLFISNSHLEKLLPTPSKSFKKFIWMFINSCIHWFFKAYYEAKREAARVAKQARQMEVRKFFWLPILPPVQAFSVSTFALIQHLICQFLNQEECQGKTCYGWEHKKYVKVSREVIFKKFSLTNHCQR